MRRVVRVVFGASAVLAAACSSGAAQETQAPRAAVALPAPVHRDPRLRDDCGPWTPTGDLGDRLVDDAASLGDPARKTAVLAALDAGPLARKVDVLRAGLRLRDDVAARACAARLKWQWIDDWECARCVDLLKGDVLRPGSEADFEEFRSYLGTADLAAFVDAMPPTPWSVDPAKAVAELHRVLHEDALDAWTKLARHPDAAVADEAVTSWWATVSDRSDRRREDVLRMDAPDLVVPPRPSPGLPAALVLLLRNRYVDFDPVDADGEPRPQPVAMDPWTRRWCLSSAPGPHDEELLLDLARRCDDDSIYTAGGIVRVLLGRMQGASSEKFLREEANDDETSVAWIALARRGAPDAVERLVAWSAEDVWGAELALYGLLGAAPERARAVLEERLLGPDEEVALRDLFRLAEALPPGSTSEAMAFDVRRTSWDGFEAKARVAPMSALRRALIGAWIPGCRTRALAEAACRDLDASYFTADLPTTAVAGDGAYESPNAFLEVATPDAFRAALRRVAQDENARWDALEALATLGDPASGALLLELTEDDPFGHATAALGRSPSPEVIAYLRDEVGTRGEHRFCAALAVAHGAPEDLGWPDEDVSAAVLEPLLAGRWRDAFHAVLAAAPDEQHGDVGVLRDDAVVRAYLERLRTRRDLGSYWYATAQLAATGDPAARADFWGAMTAGRYRIVAGADGFARTLGHDLAATMPHWIEQLRASCCVVPNSPGWGNVFDVESFSVPWRTPYDCVREIWEEGTRPGGAGFVWSRFRSCFVLGAR